MIKFWHYSFSLEKNKSESFYKSLLSIQILQYEFLGPIKLDQWGQPMEKVVYLIMSRKKDSFEIIYAGNCQETVDNEFFTKHSSFKCWVENSGFDKLLYLAILPLFESTNEEREKILNHILARYHPICNVEIKQKVKPEYKIRQRSDFDSNPITKIPCPCCGSEMKVEKILQNTTIIKCVECGLSDTRIDT
jgi:hypothetical protein